MLNRSSRDLTLPVWGPYNKKFVGFAHLADEKKGLRFDVDVFPGFYRRSLMQTRSISDGGARLWQARPDLQHFVYRYEMAENLYCDMHIAQEDEHLTARFVFVNHTDIYQSLQMNLCASIRLPTYMNNAILAADAHLPEGVTTQSFLQWSLQRQTLPHFPKAKGISLSLPGRVCYSLPPSCTFTKRSRRYFHVQIPSLRQREKRYSAPGGKT